MNAIDFLKRYHMASSDIDINFSLLKFSEEIEKGLKKVGNVSEVSVPNIPTFLNPNILIRNNEKVIVIDAGGTNLRIGISYFDGKNWQIEDVIEDKMPGLDREYSKEEFFDYIASRTKPFLDKAKNIGFCFSYRVEMDDNLDGTLLAWNKEIKAKEVVGSLIGATLLEAIKKYSDVEREIVVLNDTTAVLLGGLTINGTNIFEKLIGTIYGTGFNCCYMEEVKNIQKINNLDDGLMIINTECANFNGFVRGEFDLELARQSAYPLDALTEKMSSGKYLSTLIYKAFKKAKDDGLFSSEVMIPNEDKFDLPLVSKYLSNLNNDLDKCFKNEFDKKLFIDICYELIDRASKIVATSVSAFAIKSNVNKIGIIIEGSTFYKLNTFKERFNDYLKLILDEKHIEYKLFDGRNRILLGAALAAMSK